MIFDLDSLPPHKKMELRGGWSKEEISERISIVYDLYIECLGHLGGLETELQNRRIPSPLVHMPSYRPPLTIEEHFEFLDWKEAKKGDIK